jgi:hypothetical protein
MGRLRTLIVSIGLISILLLGYSLLSNKPESDEVADTPSDPSFEEPHEEPDEEPEPTVDRYDLIPDDAVKVTPETDTFPPILHSVMWKDPVPMPFPVNTAGAEDSPFVTPSASDFYWFFTPDPLVPAEEQLFDGVTGIYHSTKIDEGWSEPRRLDLSEGELSLDGCVYVRDDEIWFASARVGNYREIDVWIAEMTNGEVMSVRSAGERLNVEVGLGEFHVTEDGSEIYFHSDVEGGVGGRDIWVTRLVDGEWQDPENVEAVNSEGSDSLPFISQGGDELWFTRWYNGYPAIYVSRLVEGSWSEPEMVISQFAAEPTLDADGNIYFAHHFILDGVMLDADIYVAYARDQLIPADGESEPGRGYYLGVLPMPAVGQSIEDAFAEASMSSELVPVWGRPTPFYELAADLEGEWGETFLEGLIRGNGMIPLVHVSFMGEGMSLATPRGLEGATLSDESWRHKYISSILDTVEAVRPRYISLGNEVNRWYEERGYDGPDGFNHFVSLYEEAYDAVKAISPETTVFCTFAREIVDENREADLDVLSYFDPDKLDILVFTSYPYSLQGVNRPEDLPDDYYSRAYEYVPEKPLAFSEVAWTSHEAFGGEQSQADFLVQLTGRLTLDSGVPLSFVSWNWLTDLSIDDHTGLIDWNGEPKEAYDIWLGLSSGA